MKRIIGLALASAALALLFIGPALDVRESIKKSRALPDIPVAYLRLEDKTLVALHGSASVKCNAADLGAVAYRAGKVAGACWNTDKHDIYVNVLSQPFDLVHVARKTLVSVRVRDLVEGSAAV